jgi:FkbM family methyltransferase
MNIIAKPFLKNVNQRQADIYSHLLSVEAELNKRTEDLNLRDADTTERVARLESQCGQNEARISELLNVVEALKNEIQVRIDKKTDFSTFRKVAVDHDRLCEIYDREHRKEEDLQTLKLAALLNSKSVDVLFDIGANTGQYAKAVLTSGYRGKVVSFEPLSSAHSELKKNASAFPSWEVAERMAIGDRNSVISINVSGNSFSSSLLPMLATHEDAAPDSKYIGQEEAKIVRLDEMAQSFLADNSKCFLKLDVQGFEKQVLAGAENTLRRVVGIQTELSVTPLYEQQALMPEMIKLISDLGFELVDVQPGFADPKTGKLFQVDGIFFRK